MYIYTSTCDISMHGNLPALAPVKPYTEFALSFRASCLPSRTYNEKNSFSCLFVFYWHKYEGTCLLSEGVCFTLQFRFSSKECKRHHNIHIFSNRFWSHVEACAYNKPTLKCIDVQTSFLLITDSPKSLAEGLSGEMLWQNNSQTEFLWTDQEGA